MMNNYILRLLSLPYNLMFSKLREYDSLTSLKLKPLFRTTSEQPLQPLPAKVSKYVTPGVAHLYIVLIEEYFRDCGLQVELNGYGVFCAYTYRNQQKLLYRQRYITS